MATFCPRTIFSSVIPILLTFVVLKYLNQDKSPFQTHPKTVLMGILSLLLCYFSYDCLQRIQLQQGRPAMLVHVFHRCILFFGYMAMAALSSILFPVSASPAIYVLYIIISVGDLAYLVFQRIRGTHEESQSGTSTSPANLHEAMEDPGVIIEIVPLQTFTSPANLPDAMEANLADAMEDPGSERVSFEILPLQP